MATALYPGAYKPPHRGHFEVVRDLLSGKIKGKRYDIDNYLDTGKQVLAGEGDDSNIDKVVVFIGGKDRNGISQSDAKLIWDIYANKLGNVQIVAGAMNPMMEAKSYAKANPNEECLAITGVRSEDDFIDLKRVTTFKSRDNVDGFAIGAQGGGVRASDFRSAILSGNLDTITDFFPKELDREEILLILDKLKSVIVAEMLTQSMDGFLDTYFEKEVIKEATPHRLPAEEKNKLDILYNYLKNLVPQGANISHDQNRITVHYDDVISENSIDVGEITEHIGSILEYMLDQGMSITPIPDIKVNKEPQDFFGKTAYYDPTSQRVVLYIANRHPKDVCRSFTHEMIHHIQNIEGRLGNITTSNTNEDDDLLELEKEAYLEGNITFRNWEDSIKNPTTENYADGKVKEATFDDIKNLSHDKVKKIFALKNKISQAILNFFPHEDHMVKVEYYGRDYVDDDDELTVKKLIEYIDDRIDDNVLLNDDISILPARDKSPTLFIDVGENSFEITSLDDEEFFSENFKDGKKKGKSRPGRVKRSGASCKGSVADLRRKAKNASGEKAKMYHWCANMKAGKKK